MEDSKYPNINLTVIIRNDAPMVFCGDSPTYRSVKVELTTHQLNQLRLKYVGKSGKEIYHEQVSKCFIED